MQPKPVVPEQAQKLTPSQSPAEPCASPQQPSRFAERAIPFVMFAVAGYLFFASLTYDAYQRPLPPPPPANATLSSMPSLTGLYIQRLAHRKGWVHNNFVRGPYGEHQFRCGKLWDSACLPKNLFKKKIIVYFAPEDPSFALSVVDAQTGKEVRPLARQSAYLRLEANDSRSLKRMFWKTTTAIVLAGLLTPFALFAYFILNRKK